MLRPSWIGLCRPHGQFCCCYHYGFVLRHFLVDEGASCCRGWRASRMSYLATLFLGVLDPCTCAPLSLGWPASYCSGFNSSLLPICIWCLRARWWSILAATMTPEVLVVSVVLDWAGAGSGQPRQDERVMFLQLCRARFLKGLLLMVPSLPPSSCHVAPAYA